MLGEKCRELYINVIKFVLSVLSPATADLLEPPGARSSAGTEMGWPSMAKSCGNEINGGNIYFSKYSVQIHTHLLFVVYILVIQIHNCLLSDLKFPGILVYCWHRTKFIPVYALWVVGQANSQTWQTTNDSIRIARASKLALDSLTWQGKKSLCVLMLGEKC